MIAKMVEDDQAKAAKIKQLAALGDSAFFDAQTTDSLITKARIQCPDNVDKQRLADILSQATYSYIHSLISFPLTSNEKAALEKMREHLLAYQDLRSTVQHLPHPPYLLNKRIVEAAKDDIDGLLDYCAKPGRPAETATRLLVANLAGLFQFLTSQQPSATATEIKRKQVNFADFLRAFDSALIARLRALNIAPIIDPRDREPANSGIFRDPGALSKLIKASLSDRTKEPSNLLDEPSELVWQSACARYKINLLKRTMVTPMNPERSVENTPPDPNEIFR